MALQRDRADLDRFARMTEGHQRLSPAEIAAAEPALVDRFAGGLYYAEEGHLSPEPALRFLLEQAQAAGAEIRLGEGEFPPMPISSSIAAGSPPNATCKLCAACAASGSC